jgi:ubiquinone/menaquinone biosynthesis C-methylase UbiE
MAGNKILEFWEEQAALAEKSGSKDLLAKELEAAALSRRMADGLKAAEFGCGNGATAIRIASQYDLTIDCFDFSAAMIESGKAAAVKAGMGDRLSFAVADVQAEPKLPSQYDVIYTERMLINLQSWELQEQAIRYFASNLNPGGLLVFCENSINGLGKLNTLRSMVGLPAITPPWHNRYLDDDAMLALAIPGIQLKEVEPFSSTYYFLSRVVNAWLAQESGSQPAYDAPVNRLSLSLPPFGDCAQGKLWVFEKSS